jgi:hypothetical protein
MTMPERHPALGEGVDEDFGPAGARPNNDGESNMRIRYFSIAVALAAAVMVSQACADHARPGLLHDFGMPVTEEDPAYVSTATPLMIDRCKAFLRSMKIDKQGNILDCDHNYRGGFCIGWINATAVFMNFRDGRGGPMLGVCLPKDIDSKKVIETFLDFADRHDDDIKYNPSFLIYWSLLEKYPCKK